jgi:hypothetical protein
MSWKDWSYNKKGALIGLIIGVIWSIIAFLFVNVNTFFAFPYILCIWISQCSGENCFGCFFLGLPFFSIILSPAIGAIIGYIISKIKGAEK